MGTRGVVERLIQHEAQCKNEIKIKVFIFSNSFYIHTATFPLKFLTIQIIYDRMILT